jgi:hypothetical protein
MANLTAGYLSNFKQKFGKKDISLKAIFCVIKKQEFL